MSSTLALHVRITCETGKREQFLRHYESFVSSARNEAGTLAYYVGTPATNRSGTEVLIFELYADRDALNSHMASADMQTFREQTTGLIQKTSVKLATPITNSFLRSLPDSKPGLTIVAHMEYSQHANMDEVKGKASNFIDFCRGEEAETHSYVWAVEEGNPRSILVFEQFKSQEFCFDTHMKTDGFIDTTKTHAEGLVTNPTFTKTEFGFDKQWSFQGS